MASNFNWEDIGSNSLAELKRETNKLGIPVKPRTPKKDIVKMLENHKSAQKPKTNPTYINPKLLMTSPNNSQTSSKNNSTRDSPIPQRSAQKQNNISPQPEREERKYNNIINTPQSTRYEKNVFSSENTFQRSQQQEKRELSPVAPSTSEKHRPHSSHKKTPSTHTPDEHKVHYSNSEHYPRPPASAFRECYILPKNLTICFYILAALTIIFSVAGVLLHPLFVFAIISGILLYVVRRRQNQHLEKMSKSLASKIVSYLNNDCGGKALRSHLKVKFNADTQVMRRTATFLTSKKRIQIRDKSNKDQVWTLISSPKN